MRAATVGSPISMPPSVQVSPRIHYFDWLRAIAVLGVVIYHALLPFAKDGWFIRNAERSELLSAIVQLLETFGLPILFLLAGASARFALQSRPVRAFLKERATRLLVPFVVGTVLLTPPAGYFMALHSGTVSGSFPEYLVAYPGIVFAYNVNHIGLSPALFHVGMHLWFLAWLFIFAVLGSPIFAFLGSARGALLVDELSKRARWRGATLLLAAPITVPIVGLYTYASPGVWDWWAFGWFGVVFVVGYLLYSDERLVAAARRDMLPALVAAVLGSAALWAMDFVHWAAVPQTYDGTYVLMLTVYGITGWAWTLTLLGVGMRVSFMQRRLPPQASEAVLPTYVVHFPIVIAISFLVVQWPLDLWGKVVINVGLGVGVTLLVVAAALRLPLLRPLLGVRARPSVVRAPPAPPAVVPASGR
jgi:glucans biosynthesis protein C